jgi:SNF2 family DNA or RNA helicase
MVYVCQNSLRDSMGDEFKKWNSPLKVCVLQPGSRPRRLKQIQGDWDVLIVNYEATRGLWADIIRMRPQVLAVDESQNIKHRTALQTKAIRKIAEATKILGGHRVLMSGTPITKNALNLWSQTDILYPEKMPSKHPLGFGSYRAYERTVSEVKPHPRLGMRAPIHEFRPERVAEVLEHMAPYTRVIRSEDVLPELPPQSFITVRLHMEDEQRRIYNALKRDMVAVLDRTAVDAVSAGILATYGVKPLAGNLTEDDFTVVSNLATTLKIRLQQVTSGFVKTATGAEVSLRNLMETTRR